MGERGIAEMGVLYGCGSIFLEIRGKYFLFLPEFGEDESNLTREHQPKLYQNFPTFPGNFSTTLG